MIARLLLLHCLACALPISATPPALAERFAALAALHPLAADFTEARHTPLKRRPVIIRGTVRIDRDRGLSLAYDHSRAPLVILDADGLLLRYPDGREQPAPPEAEEDLRILHALFAFDFDTLQKSYAHDLRDAPDGTWTLTFTRRPEATSSYANLALTANADHLTAITLAKTPNVRTEITLSPPRPLPAFSPEDLTRYFR